jgi:hypothetical protein
MQPSEVGDVDRDVLIAAHLARMAYLPPDQFLIDAPIPVRHLLPEQDQLFFIESENDCQLYIWYYMRKLYVDVRGTDSARDVIVDLNVTTVDLGSGVHVHHGFYNQFRSIEEELDRYINDDCDIIHFVSHSLGASVSTLGAYFFGKKYPDMKIFNYTFGSPRVGNQRFVDDFPENVTTVRVYNFEDPVPMIPMSYRFSHVNKNCICLMGGHCDDYDRDYFWLLRPFTSFIQLNLFNLVEYHHMEHYIKYLEKNEYLCIIKEQDADEDDSIDTPTC